MKKVLFVANTLQMGGAERILYNVIKKPLEHPKVINQLIN